MYSNFPDVYNTKWESWTLFFLPSPTTHIEKCLSLSPAHLPFTPCPCAVWFLLLPLHRICIGRSLQWHPGGWTWWTVSSRGTYSSLMYIASLRVFHALSVFFLSPGLAGSFVSIPSLFVPLPVMFSGIFVSFYTLINFGNVSDSSQFCWSRSDLFPELESCVCNSHYISQTYRVAMPRTFSPQKDKQHYYSLSNLVNQNLGVILITVS